MDVPAGMEGVFAFDGVSGCFGPRGLYMWGDGATRLIPAEDGCVATPKKIAGIESLISSASTGQSAALLCTMCIIPAILLIISSTIYLRKYTLDEKYYDEICRELERRG